MYFITFYFYIISELQFYIIFNILLDNEVMETSKRRSFLPLIFIIKTTHNPQFLDSLRRRACARTQLIKPNYLVIAESGSSLCPVALLKLYKDSSHLSLDSDEYIFRPISASNSSKRLVSVNKPISYSTYTRSFKKSFRDIVPDITNFSTHFQVELLLLRILEFLKEISSAMVAGLQFRPRTLTLKTL